MGRDSYAAALLAGGLILALTAESQTPGAISLRDARARALAQGWDLLAAKSDLDLAEAQRTLAGALPNPQLGATFNKLTTTDLPPGTTPAGSARDTVVALTQTIEIGKRGNRIRSADAGVTSARARFEFARARVDAAVVKAYVAALAADATARIDRASANSLARSAQIAGLRFEAGEIAQVERDQVAIAAGRFEADTRSAEAAAVSARIALETLLGEPNPAGQLVLADDLDQLATLGASLVARLAVPAAAGPELEARGDVRAAAAGVEQASADLNLQKHLRIPDPALLVQYERDESLPEPNSLGLGVSFTLPLLSRNAGGIRAAEVAQAVSQRELAQARARAQAEAAAARASFAAAQQRRALVHDRLLPQAVQVQETVAFAYEKGGASLLELLEAERNLNDLRLAALNTQAEAVSAAADLAAAFGEVLE